jgi:hypothetical protein
MRIGGSNNENLEFQYQFKSDHVLILGKLYF